MSCVFQNIDPHPPLRPLSVYPPPLLPGGEGGGGSIFWKTQDTALYSTYYIESSLGPAMQNTCTYVCIKWVKFMFCVLKE
jgi:hypothetical protein